MTAVSYIEQHYQLRYNELLQRVEMKVSESFMPLSPRMINTLMLEMLEAGVNIDRKMLLLYLNSSRVVSYHPARAYLERLPQVKMRKKDYIEMLCKCIPGMLFQDKYWFRIWLLGEVAVWLGWLDRMPKNACRVMLLLNDFTLKERETFVKLILPEELSNENLLNVRCCMSGCKTRSNEWKLELRDDGAPFRKIRRKFAYKKELYSQILLELNDGAQWWVDKEKIRQLKGSKGESNAAEVSLFMQVFVPMVAVTDGVRSLRLTDLADCVSFRTGKTLNASQRNRLGRWLTAEYRAGRVLKRYVNGSTSYLVKGNGWTL